MKRRPFQQVSLPTVLKFLAELDERAFGTLQDEVIGPNAFDIEKERIIPLAKSMGRESSDVSLLVSALSFLHEEIHEDKQSISTEDLLSYISDILEEINRLNKNDAFDASNTDKLINRLSSLLSQTSNVKVFKKLSRLRKGYLANALEFGSFVDLRANYNDAATEIAEYVPILQFGIKTDSSDPALREIVLQLDERALARLKDAVLRCEAKLETALNKSIASPHVVKR